MQSKILGSHEGLLVTGARTNLDQVLRTGIYLFADQSLTEVGRGRPEGGRESTGFRGVWER